MLTWNRNDLADAARLLSRDHADARSRRHAENLLATTHDAVWLYRVREIQFAATIAQTLRTRPEDAADLWMPWLDVRRPDVSLDEWRAFDERLVDAAVAVDRWWDAGSVFQDLLAAPEEAREDMIRELCHENLRHENASCDVVLVTFCLAVEEQQRTLGGEDGVRAARLAVQVADVLQERSPLPLKASVLTDRLVLACGRLANAHRVLGRIREANEAMNRARLFAGLFEPAPWVAAEVASLHASLLTDEGLDLELAEKRADQAIRIYETFDVHMAAKTRVKKAAIQRLRGNRSYVSMYLQAIKSLDLCRAPGYADGASNSALYYLVKDGRVREATRCRYQLRWPSSPVEHARRLSVEGCIELAIGRPDLAKFLLAKSSQRFTKLLRPGDAMVALLYLAVACYRLGDNRSARDQLATAFHLSQACGYAATQDIGRLLANLETEADLDSKMLRLAFEAGGCLSPSGAEAPSAD
jgi:tetratricopeptide (TPR) repeat protein